MSTLAVQSYRQLKAPTETPMPVLARTPTGSKAPPVVPSAALLVVIHAVLLQPDVVWPRVVLFLCGAASNLAA